MKRPSYTPRQVAVRAQEAASQLLPALDRDGLVAQFLRSYAQEAKRPGRTSGPQRYRELMETIRRESLLVLALAIDEEFPRRLGVRSNRNVTPPEAELVRLFREEFFVALGRSLDWDKKEFESFCRDLELYRKLYGKLPRPPRGSRSAVVPKGPFVDRCALLLDPSMLDQARRAAAKFELVLLAGGSSILKRVFSRRRE